MLEIDTATVTPETVLIASGHVKKFNDFTVKDLTTGAYHRADHLLEDFMDELMKVSGTTPDQMAEYRVVKKLADDYTLEQLTEIMKKYNVVVRINKQNPNQIKSLTSFFRVLIAIQFLIHFLLI